MTILTPIGWNNGKPQRLEVGEKISASYVDSPSSSDIPLSSALPEPLASETTVQGALSAIAPLLESPAILLAKTVIIRGATGTPAAGSTNNRIPRFNAEAYNNGGSDFTFTDDAALGSYFTIVTPGLYFVQGSFISSTNAYAVVARGSALTNSINLTTTNLDDYPLGVATAGSGQPYISGYVQCATDDLLHLISNVAVNTLYPGLWKFGLVGPF